MTRQKVLECDIQLKYDCNLFFVIDHAEDPALPFQAIPPYHVMSPVGLIQQVQNEPAIVSVFRRLVPYYFVHTLRKHQV